MEVELTCVSSLWEMMGCVRVPAGSLVAGEREKTGHTAHPQPKL